jgi:hypothetical protein
LRSHVLFSSGKTALNAAIAASRDAIGARK